MWFYVVTGIVLIAAIGFATQTARVIRRNRPGPGEPVDPETTIGISRLSLYANAALSQAFLLAIIWIGLYLSDVSSSPLGLMGSTGLTLALVLGVAVGLVLAAVNEGIERVVGRVGLAHDELLRRLLAPSTPVEWTTLALVVLPVVALFEELLFRGMLIGGIGAGLGISPWLLVLGSSVLFALGHVVQGLGGLLAAGVLGLLLGGAFVLTESLIVVVIAHYLVNLLEFVRHPAP